jgi:hypothetical protein
MPATLRLSREHAGLAELHPRPFQVALDGEPIGSIANHETFETSVAPGHHTLRVSTGRYTSKGRAFEATEGEVVSFRCHGARIWPIYLASIVVPTIALKLRRE